MTVWLKKLEDKQEQLVLLINKFELASATIVAISKQWLLIEPFFKLLKQRLKIRTFIGTCANAVRNQSWTALVAVFVVCYPQFRSHSR